MLFVFVTLLLTLLNCHLSQATYVVGWGSNSFGQLGNGTTTTAFTPVVVGGYTGLSVSNIRIGLSTHFAMMADGSVYCAGNNFYGQLGIGNTYNQNQPVNSTGCYGLDVYPVGPNSVGYNSGLQTAYGWGLGAGYIAETSTTISQQTPRLFKTTVQSLQGSGSTAILGVNSAWGATFITLNSGVWSAGAVITNTGYNPDSDAKLGTGVTTDQTQLSRLSFLDESGDAVSVSQIFNSDASHVCAVSSEATLYCWGKNNNGQLGIGTTTDALTPAIVSFFDDNQLYVAQIRTGDSHTIALTCGGQVYAWGTNVYGNLGLGTNDSDPHPYPTLVATLSNSNIVEIKSAMNSVFARNLTNDWFVWGANTANITQLPLTGNQLYPVNNPIFKSLGLTRLATNSKSTFALGWIDLSASTSPSSNCPTLINECALGISDCAANTLCVDTERSYLCLCGSGFTGDGIDPKYGGSGCNDIDECSEVPSVCDPLAGCYNQLGGFACTCPSGYQGDGTANGTGCVDINECAIGGYCPPNTDCTNTIGSFNCYCSPGYRGIGTTPCGPVCVDTDECQTNVDNCTGNTYCVNTPGNYSCPCLSGYSGASCTDINECNTGRHDCADQSYCVNLQGSFTCKCPSGFTGDGVSTVNGGVGCLDINECTLGNYCSPYASCANSVGSYKCTCNKNFTGNGTVCTDVNECLNATLNKCVSSSNNGNCTNTVGGYYCSCTSGYTGDGMTTGSGCTDINECTTGANNCDTLATCTNLPGTFNCTCPTGYLGSGTLCYTVNCSIGTYPSNATACAPCPAGTYNNKTGVQACTPCPAGTYNGNTGSKVATACTNCPLSQYSNAGASSCTTCALGSIATSYGTATCSLCPAGTTSSGGACKNCGAGYYSSSPGSSDCLPCPAGYYNPNATASACTPCAPGTISSGRASICTPCAAGRYQPQSGQYYCFGCAPGSSTQNSTGATSCTACAAGSSASAFSSPTCSTCATGTYSSTGSDSCLSCPPGTFNNQTGQSSCTLCSNWQFSDTAGATTCSPCYQGYAGETEYGSVNCLACPPGTYRTTGALSVCLPCYTGSANQLAAQPHCSLCMGGYYATKCGQTTCDACPPSTYSSYNATGQTYCPFCRFGHASYGTAYFCF